MNEALNLASAIRQSIKALNFEIAELKRPRRGLAPYEYDAIQDDLNARIKAKFELLDYLTANNLSV